MSGRRTKKYLNNADLLREIHKSKMSYCWLLDKTYSNYDYIVFDIAEITDDLLKIAGKERLKRLNNQMLTKISTERNLTTKKAKEYVAENGLVLNSVPEDEIVIRVITDEHIPNEENSDKKVRVNFEPFKHYIVDNSGEIFEVARSHWYGDLETGHFCLTHGSQTNELGKMFIKLTEEISHKPNYRNYTYIDEMMGEARIQLVKNALLFKESLLYRKVNPTNQLNPFAYYTSFVNNAFRGVLNSEKTVRNIRDDLLEVYGFIPSNTRQVEIEMKMVDIKNNS